MQNRNLEIFALIGFIFTLKKTLNVSKFIKKYFLTKTKNFNSIYGNNNCWVLITGSSQGIGKSFAKAFAKENCNLLLTSRDSTKLENVKEEIKIINPNIKVEYFPFDFSQINEKVNELQEILNKYEINILINNVGITKFGQIEHLTHTNIVSMINTNLISSTVLSKLVVDKIKTRNHKSLIVTSGSDLTLYTPPYTQVYTGTKDYLKAFMLCLSQENEKLDITYLNIGPVYTPTNYRKIPFKLESDDYVSHAMTQLGNYKISHGHYLHALKYKIFGNDLIMNLYTRRSLNKEFSKHL